MRSSCVTFVELFEWYLVAFVFNYGFNFFFLPEMCNNLKECTIKQ